MAFSEELLDAILDAFSGDELERLLKFRLGIDFDRVVAQGALEDRFFDLFKYLDRRDRLGEFIDAAQAARPRNPELARLAASVVSSIAAPAELEPPDQDALQRMVRKHAKFADFWAFAAEAQEISYRICLIQYPFDGGTVSGTGFLVHGDKILTNQHVMECVMEGAVDPGDVEIRFDYRTSQQGIIVNDGTPAALHGTDWLLDHSPPAPEDEEPGGGDAPTDMLDYALIRLSESLGDAPIGKKADRNDAKRHWMTVPTADPRLKAGDDILLLQHPRGFPLKRTLGRITGQNGNGSRVRYDANSLKGSSGGAVLTGDLELVALHHAGDPNFERLAQYNQGVPLHLITQHMQTRGVEPFWS